MPITQDRLLKILEAGEKLWEEHEASFGKLVMLFEMWQGKEFSDAEFKEELWLMIQSRRQEPPAALTIERHAYNSTIKRNHTIKLKRQQMRSHGIGHTPRQFKDPARQALADARRSGPTIQLPQAADPKLAVALAKAKELEVQNDGFVDPFAEVSPGDGITLADLTTPATSAEIEAFRKFNEGAKTDE